MLGDRVLHFVDSVDTVTCETAFELIEVSWNDEMLRDRAECLVIGTLD